MISLTKGMNSITSLGIGTRFEQYKDLFTSLGVQASYDDLKTDSSASSNLIKQSGTYEKFQRIIFTYDKRNNHLCQLQVQL